MKTKRDVIKDFAKGIVVFNDESWVRLIEYQKLQEENEQLKAYIEQFKDCSNCKHWSYSTRLLAYVCDCSDKISDSIDSRTYEHCDKWEIEE